jgi:hypothetical protein
VKRQFFFLAFFFSLFSFQAAKAQNCDTSKISLSYFNPGPFPPTNQIDFNCLDSALILQVTPHIDCNSIASDGSNFKVILPNGDIVKAIFAEARNCIGDSSNAILVRLEQPLFLNMLGKLAIGKSTNQSTIKSFCAQRPWDLDSINISVQGCFVTRFDTVQATQTASQNVELNWAMMQNPPTAPFPVYLFSSFKIYRKTTSDNQFQLIDSVSDFYQTSFSDNNFPADYIGTVDYFISIKLLNIEVAFSDTVTLNVVSKTEPLAFPVPFQKELNLALGRDGEKEISIFTSDGKVVFAQKTTDFFLVVQTDAWPKGVYFIRVRGKEETVQRVVKF